MTTALLLLATATAPAAMLRVGVASRLPAPLARSAARMQMEKLTVTLVGCSNGVGVGLDETNRIDMLKPDSPAEAELMMGDRVLQWNGIEMTDFTGERRLLKDVVVPADSHTLVVERRLDKLAAAAAAAVAASDSGTTAAAAAKEGDWKTQETWTNKEAKWKAQESWGEADGGSSTWG